MKTDTYNGSVIVHLAQEFLQRDVFLHGQFGFDAAFWVFGAVAVLGGLLVVGAVEAADGGFLLYGGGGGVEGHVDVWVGIVVVGGG